MSNSALDNSKKKLREKRREWAPHLWEGCDAFTWWRMLARNQFAIDLPHLYVAFIVSFVSLYHTLFKGLQALCYGRQVAHTNIRHAPLFIIGHWRTGTTLLHEMLILDERHNYPNTYECFDPSHFLLTERFFTRWVRFLMPSHRPMDNMPAGWERPQEDEFALCLLGLPSPYWTIAFPNHPPQFQEYLDLRGLTPSALAAWKKVFRQFLLQLTFRDPRRLVLKSPPHSCRIPILLDMFPDARFVHIVRNPYVVFPSTINLWKSLYEAHGLQTPGLQGLEEHVFQTFARVYERIEEDKRLIPSGRFHEIRYEDLVREPAAQLRKLYDRLELGGYEAFLPRLEKFLESTRKYETNRYQLSVEQKQAIDRRWGPMIEQYGYAQYPSGTSQEGRNAKNSDDPASAIPRIVGAG
jgi:hypothetical protein